MTPRFRNACTTAVLLLAGCNSPLIRSQSPELEETVVVEEERSGARLIRDVAVPRGHNWWLKVQGVGLVMNLPNTGSDPPPSGLRSALLHEMQSHEVRQPQQVLAAPTTSLVTVMAYLPPGCTKGDPVDLIVSTPRDSKTTSLRGGWLMQTRLREMQLLDDTLKTGHVMALGGGDVVVNAVFEEHGRDRNEVRGKVLGGGASLTTRPLGLILNEEYSSARLSASLGAAINGRFHRFHGGNKTGVANPRRDNYVELALHDRYKYNVTRYMSVVLSIAIGETPVERAERLVLLEKKLAEPTSAAKAALELEALGDEGVPILKRALASHDSEVRFYAAEALAYLDVAEAAEPLAEAARKEPAFRWYALTALATMDHVGAYDALNELLHVESIETRYGAFRALRTRNAADPLVKGEVLEGRFSYHLISTTGEPMVHFSRSRRPEIVVFGHDQQLSPPAFLYAGKQILVKGQGSDQLRVVRFTADDDDELAELCSTRLDDAIRAIVKLGGTYGDVLEFVRSAKAGGYLASRVEVNALARPNREYRRNRTDVSAEADDAETAEEGSSRPSRRVPEMFYDPEERSMLEAEQEPRLDGETLKEPVADEQQDEGVFARMRSWFTE